MPQAQRRQPSAVVQHLLNEPHRFEFFQAVRLLEQWLKDGSGTASAGAGAGRLRFCNSLSLSFAPSEVAKLEVISEHGPGRPERPDSAPAQAGDMDRGQPLPSAHGVARVALTPAFMGLLGVNGALPTFYTEMLAQREAASRDRAPRAFLDIFQHRAVTLFYQAWRKHRLPLQFERDRRRHFLPEVLAIAGLGQSSLHGRLEPEAGGVADDALAHYAGLLQQRPTSAALIPRLLQRYFDVPVRLESFVGRWFDLPATSQTTLGLGNGQLGHDAVIGQRVWQRDLRMRLVLGPMPRERFVRFLPGSPGERALRSWLALLTGAVIEYEVRLVLQACDVVPARLLPDSSVGPGARLGWDAFLVSQPTQSDRSEPGYDIHALA